MKKRVLIVDYNHMVHTYFRSKFRLSTTVVVNGQRIEKDTTIQSGTIKNIHNWSNHGANPTAVCFDRRVTSRKAWFQENLPNMLVGSSGEYKGSRERMPDAMFEGAADSQHILQQAGVSVFAENNYEADDLVFACVLRAKEKYPGLPIDVITNDADLLPLVDDTVSVFIRSVKGTYAEDKSIEKSKYIQVTPRNYQRVVEDMSAFKGFDMPYNTVLLHKLLRGDSSDEFQDKEISRMFSPKRYNQFVDKMKEGCIDLSNIFRYGVPTYKILYKGTDREFNGTMKEALASHDKGMLYQKVCNPVELNNILNVLNMYTDLSESQLGMLEKAYWGINLNQAFPNSNSALQRRSYVVGAKGRPDIHEFNEVELQKCLSPLRINLRLV